MGKMAEFQQRMQELMNAHAALVEGEEEYGEDYPDVQQRFDETRDAVYAFVSDLTGEPAPVFGVTTIDDEESGPCLDPTKMHGWADQFGGTDDPTVT